GLGFGHAAREIGPPGQIDGPAVRRPGPGLLGARGRGVQGPRPVHQLHHGQHVADGRDQADAVVRKIKAVPDGPHQLLADVDGTAAHARRDAAGPVDGVAADPHKDEVPHGARLGQHPQVFHLKSLYLGAPHHRLAGAPQTGLQRLDGKKTRLRGGVQQSRHHAGDQEGANGSAQGSHPFHSMPASQLYISSLPPAVVLPSPDPGKWRDISWYTISARPSVPAAAIIRARSWSSISSKRRTPGPSSMPVDITVRRMPRHSISRNSASSCSLAQRSRASSPAELEGRSQLGVKAKPLPPLAPLGTAGPAAPREGPATGRTGAAALPVSAATAASKAAWNPPAGLAFRVGPAPWPAARPAPPAVPLKASVMPHSS